MGRAFAPVVLLVAVCGCTGAGSGARSNDPFFGRTRVDPPPTGWGLSQPAPDPSYANTRPSGSAAGSPVRSTVAPNSSPFGLSPGNRFSSAPQTGLGGTAGGTILSPPNVVLPSQASPATEPRQPTSTAPIAPQSPPTTPSTAPSTPNTLQPPTVNLNPSAGASSSPAWPVGSALAGEARGGDQIAIPEAARQPVNPTVPGEDRSGLTGAVATRPGSNGWSAPAAVTASNAGSSATASGSSSRLGLSSVASNAGAASGFSTPAGIAAPVGPTTADSASGSALAGRERIVRVLEPRPANQTGARWAPVSGGTSAAPLPARTPSTQGAIDIMDLPPATLPAPFRGSQSAISAGEIQLVSGTQELGGPSATSAQDRRAATGAISVSSTGGSAWEPQGSAKGQPGAK